jgi:hypothetical protein
MTIEVGLGDPPVVVGSAVVANPDLTEFELQGLDVAFSGLAESQIWRARQLDGSASSEWSAPVSPRSYLEDWPESPRPPPPTIDPVITHECADTLAVRHLPGATLYVVTNGDRMGATENAGNSSGHTILVASAPFDPGDVLRVYQSFCGDDSAESEPVVALAEPSSMAPPTISPFFEGQELIAIGTLTHGSHQSLESSIAGPIASFGPIRSRAGSRTSGAISDGRSRSGSR